LASLGIDGPSARPAVEGILLVDDDTFFPANPSSAEHDGHCDDSDLHSHIQ